MYQFEIDIVKFRISQYEDDDYEGFIIEYGLKFDDKFRPAPISVHLLSFDQARQACEYWAKLNFPKEIVSGKDCTIISPWSFAQLKEAVNSLKKKIGEGIN